MSWIFQRYSNDMTYLEISETTMVSGEEVRMVSASVDISNDTLLFLLPFNERERTSVTNRFNVNYNSSQIRLLFLEKQCT